jgi:hypothetical protein
MAARSNKKTDATEHSGMLNHVGLLANGLPQARPGRPLSSHPMIQYSTTPTVQITAERSGRRPRRTGTCRRRRQLLSQVRGDAAQADPADVTVPSGSLHDESHRAVQSIDSTENVNPACSKDAGSLPITAWASPRVLNASAFSRGPNVRWSPKRGGDTHISRPLALTALITNLAGTFALLMPSF